MTRRQQPEKTGTAAAPSQTLSHSKTNVRKS